MFCANKDEAIMILDFIKNQYEKQDAVGCLKYIEALEMGINALKVVQSDEKIY